MSDVFTSFISDIRSSVADGTFVKVVLSNYKGSDEHLQKLMMRLLETKKGLRASILYRFRTKDISKNFDVDDGIDAVSEAALGGFRSGHLFTTQRDIHFEIGKRGKQRLRSAKPTFVSLPRRDHDRVKKMHVDPGQHYLNALGITDKSGRVRDKQQDKWRQINKFVEICSGLVGRSFSGRREISVLDMGSGKGYLTFAIYDYLVNSLKIEAEVTGIEMRGELVDLCNSIARDSNFKGLKFAAGSIRDTDVAGFDVLIALHACDTATDDALFRGIKAGAKLILAAPCCHKEIRPQIEPNLILQDILKHGTLMEREAELITDGIRSMLMELSGYTTKVVDFVPIQHTPKNNLIISVRSKKTVAQDRLRRNLAELKTFYGIRHHHLEELLKREPAWVRLLDPKPSDDV